MSQLFSGKDKDQNEKCLRFITFLSTNRLNKAMIDRKRRGKTTISPLLTFNLKVGFTFSVLSPKACPYAMALSFWEI